MTGNIEDFPQHNRNVEVVYGTDEKLHGAEAGKKFEQAHAVLIDSLDLEQLRTLLTGVTHSLMENKPVAAYEKVGEIDAFIKRYMLGNARIWPPERGIRK